MTDDNASATRGARVLGGRPTSEQSATDGMYIAVAATRLSLKNRILVEVLHGGQEYEAERFIGDARDALLRLADEAHGDAERLRDIMREIRGLGLRRRRRQGYRRDDVTNLRRRLEQAELVEQTLRARADDDDALRELVSAAHEAAWDEIARNIHHNLASEYERVVVDEADREDRERRIDEVATIDLARLAEETAGRRAESGDAAEEHGARNARASRGSRGSGAIRPSRGNRLRAWWARRRGR
ncbi:hypothetical protein GCM10011490_10400 [Pseudoclavibacter endophyticus]|uniref:Asparagine synthase n=1 Tax=Pseudoclavibacter endophyticus TaxID=1778590 RepID=A0A6H9WN56_9MICO|nr:asparagine synthase [Pseudoclavibacter endophyticus]KAB1649518.1 asparagine synthase [Pseudoclavibacter endophyticus]GGA61959.1 hypothetical protein GCM10011490_10400 [Pseudoclavibacter endophyticus]